MYICIYMHIYTFIYTCVCVYMHTYVVDDIIYDLYVIVDA